MSPCRLHVVSGCMHCPQVWGEETGLAKLTGDLGKTDAIVATLSEEIRFVHEATYQQLM